jgi:hypothetical protein
MYDIEDKPNIKEFIFVFIINIIIMHGLYKLFYYL